MDIAPFQKIPKDLPYFDFKYENIDFPLIKEYIS